MTPIDIKIDNINLLEDFLNANPESQKQFRYYINRTFDCLSNHKLTRLYFENNICVGYGHLDFDKFLWLGICVGDKFHRMGYGNLIMDDLLSHTDDDIYLTVDKENISAQELYKKKGFVIEKVNESNFRMLKKNN